MLAALHALHGRESPTFEKLSANFVSEDNAQEEMQNGNG